MHPALEALHLRLVASSAAGRLHLATRILLALAFIPTGLVKVYGRPFSALPVEHPIGAFFSALHQTGAWWHFLGLGQVAAGILLLLPGTSLLGAILFLPILVNVVVLTWALDFTGTVWITSAMLLANLFLLAWDADRLAPALRSILRPRPSVPGMPRLERAGWLLGGLGGAILLMWTRGFWIPPAPLDGFDGWIAGFPLALAALGALLVVGSWVRGARSAGGGSGRARVRGPGS
jgi:hypothetical protein